jgi:hypothetical protein
MAFEPFRIACLGSNRKNMKSPKYAVRYSAHGMAYLPLKPQKFDLSLEEAIEECERWKCYADTVGGDAFLVDEHSCPPNY